MSDHSLQEVSSGPQINASLTRTSTNDEMVSTAVAATDELENLKTCFGNLTGQVWHEDDDWMDDDDENEFGKTSNHQPQTDNIDDMYNFESLEIDQNSITEAVKKVFLHFIENYLTIENAHHIGVGVTRNVNIVDEHFKQDYQIFLQLVRTIAENFNFGFQNKIDKYVCFSGLRDQQQLGLFMKMQFKTARDDVESSEDFKQDNAFRPILKQVLQAMLQKLLNIYKDDNEEIIKLESKLTTHVQFQVSECCSKKLQDCVNMMSKHPKINPEKIISCLANESVEIFHNVMEYEERINHKVSEGVQTLKKTLDHMKIPKQEMPEVSLTQEKSSIQQQIKEISETVQKHKKISQEKQKLFQIENRKLSATSFQDTSLEDTLSNKENIPQTEVVLKHGESTSIQSKAAELSVIEPNFKPMEHKERKIPASASPLQNTVSIPKTRRNNSTQQDSNSNKKGKKPDEQTQTQHPSTKFQTAKSNSPVNKTSEDMKAVGTENQLNPGKEKIQLPLFLYLNCRNHEVEMATLKHTNSTEILKLKIRNGDIKTTGIVAYSKIDNTFYFGIDALHKKRSNKSIHCHDIFTLLLMEGDESQYGAMALEKFFTHLKDELEEGNNAKFNHVITILPDWLLVQHKYSLTRILQPEVFSKVTCHEESVVVGAGYFQEKFMIQQQKKIPIELEAGSQSPLVIFLESFGFIYVKILVVFDDGKGNDFIKKVTAQSNENENRQNETWASKWNWKGDQKILRSTNVAPDTSATKRLYKKALHNFSRILNKGKLRKWNKAKMSFIVVSDNTEWKNEIAKITAKSVRSQNTDCGMDWKSLVLKGSALCHFEDAEQFNFHLLGGEIPRSNKNPAAINSRHQRVKKERGTNIEALCCLKFK